MKYFAYQRGTRGPEPVVFHDERPQGAANKRAVIDGTLREVPAELADLSVERLAEHFQKEVTNGLQRRQAAASAALASRRFPYRASAHGRVERLGRGILC